MKGLQNHLLHYSVLSAVETKDVIHFTFYFWWFLSLSASPQDYLHGWFPMKKEKIKALSFLSSYFWSNSMKGYHWLRGRETGTGEKGMWSGTYTVKFILRPRREPVCIRLRRRPQQVRRSLVSLSQVLWLSLSTLWVIFLAVVLFAIIAFLHQ